MPVRDLLSAASTQGAAPADPYFYDVSLLLNGDGTNGAQNNTFLDSSTNNFTITRNGNTTQGSFSPYGTLWSNYFNGSGAYCTLASNAAFAPGLNDFTIEAWLNPSSSMGSNYVGVFVVNATNGIFFGNLTTGFGLRATNVGDVIYASTLTPNVWTHVAISRQGTNLKLFYNGVQQGSTVTNATVFAQGSAILANDTGTDYFNGYISNFRLVNGTAVYTSNFTPSTTPLTAVTNTSLLTCQSNRFIDNSSNAFAITVFGTPTVQRFSPFNPTAPYDKAVIGGSGYFDGSGDYLTTPSSASISNFSGNFTIEGWVYLNTATSYAVLVGGDGSNGWYVEYSSNRGFGAFDGSSFKGGSSSAVTGQWVHYAVTRASGTLRFFINGVNTATTTSSNFNYTQALGISAYQSGSSFINGYQSDVRINNTTALYTATFTPPTAPLTAVSGTTLLTSMTNAGIPDLAMQNNLETVGNAQVSTSVKKYGTGSLAFDGTGDYLTMPNNTTFDQTGDFTQEMWVYRTGTGSGGYDILLLKNITNWAYIGLYGSPLKAVALQHNVGFLITGSTTINNNIWYHIALTRNGSTLRLFVNGVLDGSTTYSTNTSGTANEYVGGFVTGGFSFNGNLDDVRYTSGLARYTTTFTPPTAALPTY